MSGAWWCNRLAAWLIAGGYWPEWLHTMAEPAWDAAYDADVEAWEDEQRRADRAYDDMIRDAQAAAYDEGYRDAEDAWRER